MAYMVVLLYSSGGLDICVIGVFAKRTAGDGTRERYTGDVMIPHPDDFSDSRNVLESNLRDAKSL